jgi:predicted Zn-dependent protease
MSSLEQSFNNAHQAYARGDIATARANLALLLKAAPRHAAVLHLSALIEKKTGNIAEALSLFQKALPLAPQDAELHANYANTLAAASNRAAIDMYDRAIGLAPDRHDFRLNRAISYLQFNEIAFAQRDIAYLKPIETKNPRFWTVAGEIFRAAGKIEEAKDAFERAVTLDPERVVALAALGEMSLHEGDAQSVHYFRSAHHKHPEERNLLLNLAQAMECFGEIDEAIAILKPRSLLAPEWDEGLTSIGRMMVEAGDTERAIAHYEAVIASAPTLRNLWSHYAAFLRSIDLPEKAMESLHRSKQHIPADQNVALLEAAIATDLGEKEQADAALSLLPPNMTASAAVRVRHALRFGMPDRAATLAEAHLAQNDSDIGMWALQSLSWRLTDDAREQWLNPEGILVRRMNIGFPDGVESLVETLRGLHVARHHPAGQSLRNGTQTRGGLFDRREPVLQSLRQHIMDAVDRYWADLPAQDMAHPLLRHRQSRPELQGSWSVRLTGSGFHVSHIHPAGILSSAFYIALPANLGGDKKAGWLEVGSAPSELALGLKPTAMIEPKPGCLTLFPSYLFHGTRPFGDGERLTVAFDIQAD